MDHKSGRITDEEYTRIYMDLMRESWNKNRDQWMDLLKSEEPIAFACYCPPGKFCHRHLIIKIMRALCKQHGIEFRYYGELQ